MTIITLIKHTRGNLPLEERREKLMEDVKQWMERYKEQLIFTGVVAMALAPFLWPFFLMIIFQAIILMVPILVIRLIIQRVRKEKMNGQKRRQEKPDTGNADFHTEKTVSDRSASDGKKDAKTDSASERNKETGAESIERNGKGRQEIEDVSCTALMWYKLEGRERIVRIMKKLEKEGRNSFSISPEGLCSVREKDRYRRVGVLRSFPYKEVKVLEKELRKDHIRTMQKGRYLLLSWGKEYRR